MPEPANNGPWWQGLLKYGLVPIVLALIALYQANRIEAIKYDTALAVKQARAASTKELEEIGTRLDRAQLALEEKIETSRVSIEQGQLELAQSRFDAEEKARRDAILQQYAPDLLSGDPTAVEVAVAILLVTYPEDAKEIIDTVASAKGPQAQLALQPQIDLASEVQAATGPWIVVVANDSEYQDTASYPSRLADFDYSFAIYTIGGYFVTAVGPFPSRLDAERARIPVRSEVSKGAYLIDLSKSCPYRDFRTMPSGPGYYECSLRGPLGN